MKRGNTSAPTYMSDERFTGVVLLLLPLYCADDFEIQRNCGLELFLVAMCSGWHAHTHTQKHRS